MKSFKEKRLKHLLLAAVAATALHVTAGIVYADSSNNTITLNDETIEYGYFYGGDSDSGNVANNTINFISGNYDAYFHAGNSNYSANVSGNIINVYNGTFTGGWLSGGYVGGAGTASGNVVNIYDGTFDNLGYFEGSWGSGTQNNNSVNIYGGNINGGIISGSWVTSDTTTSNNSVNISGGTINDASAITGGYLTSNGTASDNTVNISGGTINSGIQGGYVVSSGSAINNKVNISGGTINGEIIGGYVGSSGEVKDNSINIYGSPDLSNANIYAGRIGSDTDLYGSNNSLNIYTKNITAQKIGGFDGLNFYLPNNIENGDYILRLTDGSTTLTNTNVSISSSGNANLNTGDKFTLITNSNGITFGNITLNGGNVVLYDTEDENALATGTMSKGISMDYDLTLNRLYDTDGNTTGVVANIGEGHANNQPDALPGPNSSAVLIVNNRIPELPQSPAEELFEDTQASDIEKVAEQHGYEIYAHMGGSHLKFKTGGGSYVKSDNGGYDLGFARKFKTRSGIFVFAPLFEYGHGKFNSYSPNSTNDIHGYGHSKYAAGGVLLRSMNNSGFYYEGSLRGGRTDTRFASGDFLVSGNRTHVTYHTEAPIFMGHIRIGNAKRLGSKNILDVYGIYAYARQNSSDAYLSSGENYNFSSVDSSRFKAGYRLTSQVSRISQIYTGLAYQYDTSADSIARTKDVSSRSIGDKGSSGMLELGWLIKPIKDNPWAVDVNATGWIGHQEGFSAMAKLKKSF